MTAKYQSPVPWSITCNQEHTEACSSVGVQCLVVVSEMRFSSVRPIVISVTPANTPTKPQCTHIRSLAHLQSFSLSPWPNFSVLTFHQGGMKLLQRRKWLRVKERLCKLSNIMHSSFSSNFFQSLYPPSQSFSLLPLNRTTVIKFKGGKKNRNSAESFQTCVLGGRTSWYKSHRASGKYNRLRVGQNDELR